MDRSDLIFEARKAMRNTVFADKPISTEPSLKLKGREAEAYIQANPLPDLKTKRNKKAAKTPNPPENVDILTTPPEDESDET